MVNALPLALLLVADALLLTGLSLSMDYDMSIEGFAFILAGCILIATLFGTIIALQGWLWLQLSRLSRDGSTKVHPIRLSTFIYPCLPVEIADVERDDNRDSFHPGPHDLYYALVVQ